MDAQQRWVLEQLDIDVWMRVGDGRVTPIEQPDAVLGSTSLGTAPRNNPAATSDRDPAPAAAALALLREVRSTGAADLAPTDPAASRPGTDTGAGPRPDTGTGTQKDVPVRDSVPTVAGQTSESTPTGPLAVGDVPAIPRALDLWCLSVPGVLLLTDRVGLDPATQRFLRDLVRAASGHYKAVPQQANFRWPQPDLGELPVAGALRGFTQRLLGDSREALILLVGASACALDIPIAQANRWELEGAVGLAGSGTRKRALWQRIQQR